MGAERNNHKDCTVQPTNQELEQIEKEYQDGQYILSEDELIDIFANLNLVALYKADIAAFPPLPEEKQYELLQKVHAEDDKEAFDLLVLHNQRLVISIAARYYAHSKPEFIDRIQDGNLGLLQAIRKYDPDYIKENGQPHHFSTYAVWWIRQSIRRSARKSYTDLKVPEHIIAQYYELMRVKEAFWQKTAQEPTLAELAEAIGKDEQEILITLQAFNPALELTADNPSDSDEQELLSYVVDTNSPSAEEELINAQSLESFHQIISFLTPREQEIMRLKYESGLTSQEIGERFNLNPKYVRNLYIRIHKKIKQHSPHLRRNLY